MGNYPGEEVSPPCQDIFLLNETCNGRGSCIDNSSYCACEPYYSPLTNCSTTLYDDHYVSSIAYSACTLLVCIALLVGFGIEIWFDCRRKTKDTVLYSKSMVIVYSIVKLVTVLLFISGFATNSNSFASAELVMQIVAITCFGVCCFTTTVEWFSLILRVKNLGIRSDRIKIFRIMVIVVMAVLFPPVMVIGIFNALNMFNLASFDSAILITAIFIIEAIIWVYIIKALCWFKHLKNTNDGIMQSSKYRVLRKKTILLLLCNLYIIFLNALVPIMNGYPKELVGVILMRKWVNLGMEFSTLCWVWVFLQNHTLRESNISRSSTKHSEPVTTSSTSGEGVFPVLETQKGDSVKNNSG